MNRPESSLALSLFPHTNLVWATGNQEARIRATPDSVDACTSAALHLMSRHLFHDGEVLLLSRALSHLRTCADINAPISDAHALAAIAHVANGQTDRAEIILNAIIELNTPFSAMAWAMYHQSQGDLSSAVTAASLLTTLAPKAWESHYLLAQYLEEQRQKRGANAFQIDKILLSLTRSLGLGAIGTSRFWLQEATGGRLLDQKKYREAQRIFDALRQEASNSTYPHKTEILARVSFKLGVITTHVGKYTNALSHFRTCLETDASNPDTFAWMAKAHLHLGEIKAAMNACERALAISPDHVLARMALGSAYFENKETDTALTILKALLADAPQMTQVFKDIVHIRANGRDTDWLLRLLRAEVKRYERMPVRTQYHVRGHGDIAVRPRSTTLKRIEILLTTLSNSRADIVEPLVEAMDLTTDEGLRFRLWEVALTLLSRTEAEKLSNALQNAGDQFSRDSVSTAVLLSDQLEIPDLHRGVWLTPDDLQRAAGTRFEYTTDDAVLHRNIEQLREEARVWQATLLVTLGCSGTDQLSLLRDWSQRADNDLSTACHIGLAASGDEQAQRFVKARASNTALQQQVETLCAPSPIKASEGPPRFTTQGEILFCRSCGKQPTSENQMIREAKGRPETALCTDCLVEIIDASDDAITDNPATSCALCGKSNMANSVIYLSNGCEVCDGCLQLGLRRINQGEIERFLHTL